MRIIGIDLALTAQHRAIVANERSRFITPVIKFETRLADLERLRKRALEGARPDEDLVVVMEATGIVWYPPAVYFSRRGATVHVVNPRMSADLARFYKRHAKSDRLSAKVLARLPLVNPDNLYPLVLSGGDYLALQRGCKELERLRRYRRIPNLLSSPIGVNIKSEVSPCLRTRLSLFHGSPFSAGSSSVGRKQ